MSYEIEESYSILGLRNLNRKYSKSKSLNLNFEAKNIFNRQVSLDSTSPVLEPPIISSRVYYRKFFPPNVIHTSVNYQMSPLLLADPGTRSARIAEPWVPLGHEIFVERIILI